MIIRRENILISRSISLFSALTTVFLEELNMQKMDMNDAWVN